MQTLRELVARIYDKPPYIIDENILHEKGLLIIGGPPKAHKSFFLNSLCYHLATGTTLFNASRKKSRSDVPAFAVQRSYRVLMLEQEIGDFSLRDRFIPIANSIPPDQREALYDNLLTHSCDRNLRLDTQEGVRAIAKLMEEARPEILALDPLIEFHGSDENSAQEMSKVMSSVDWLRDRFNVAVVMSHHRGKVGDTMRSATDSLRGSSAIFGKGDSYFMLSSHNKAASILLVEPTIRRGVPINKFLVRLDWSDLRMKFHAWYTPKTSKEAMEALPQTEMEQ